MPRSRKLSVEEVLARMESALLQAGISRERRAIALQAVRQHEQAKAAIKPPEPDKPHVAPALWMSEARQEGESPADFIHRVYAPWIGKGFSRVDLLRLDPKLYRALGNWLLRKGNVLWFDLPTRKEVNDRWIEKMTREGWDGPEARQNTSEFERFSAAKRRRERATAKL